MRVQFTRTGHSLLGSVALRVLWKPRSWTEGRRSLLLFSIIVLVLEYIIGKESSLDLYLLLDSSLVITVEPIINTLQHSVVLVREVLLIWILV